MDTPSDLARQFFRAYAERDKERFHGMYAEHVVIVSPESRDEPDYRLEGADGIAKMRAYWDHDVAACPSRAYVVSHLHESEDTVTAEWWWRGAYENPYPGAAPGAARGQTIAIPGITVLQFAGGRIVRYDTWADSIGFLRQAGIDLGALNESNPS